MTDERSEAELRRALRLLQVGMMKQARARGWCSEYERFVEEINGAAGWDVLGKRIRRQTQTFTINTRMRTGLDDTGRVLDEFVDYIRRFKSELAVEFSIDRIYPQTSDAMDEPVGWDEEDEDAPAPILDEGLPGYDPGACNCEECRNNRLARRRDAQRRDATGRFMRVDLR